MIHYTFRAGCAIDAARFLFLIFETGYRVTNWNMAPYTNGPATVVEFESDATLFSLKGLAERVTYGYVIKVTIAEADMFTGDRVQSN